jgi:hypothetical protein
MRTCASVAPQTGSSYGATAVQKYAEEAGACKDRFEVASAHKEWSDSLIGNPERGRKWVVVAMVDVM